MRNKLLVSLVAMVFGVALVGAACSSDNSSAKAKEAEATTTTTAETTSSTTTTALTQTVVDVVAANPDFSTLASLIKAAGLTDTLAGPGPYTVLAPTDSAFARIPAATLRQLQADPQGALASVLKRHVISGTLSADDLANQVGSCIETLDGKVKVAKDGDTITVGGAPVVKTGIEASNGVVHVVDGVILAPATDC